MSERIAAELPRMQPYDSPVPGDGEIPLRRPIGVTMIALFSLGIAVLVTIRFVGLVRDDKEGLVWVLGWIPLLLIVIALISGIGLWRRSAWASGLAVQFYGLLTLLNLLNLIPMVSRSPSIWDVVGVVIFGAIVAYLLLPGVKRAFR